MNYPAASRKVSVRNPVYEFDAALSHPHRGHGMTFPCGKHQQRITQIKKGGIY